ncbi:DNA-directed RNA polymerase II subunit RPB1-like [Tachyglossus aculeatus]|uniref:DNA-directed RNA polymerase II subunit RPB1-like n=1 Tax=Tachyglossus aculeatus TaxID=9261 RepID=UPI0018F560BA|nr:DNA-directed RNA polymerase II subunit RPB1-like [Tachyglossus aculeatus]
MGMETELGIWREREPALRGIGGNSGPRAAPHPGRMPAQRPKVRVTPGLEDQRVDTHPSGRAQATPTSEDAIRQAPPTLDSQHPSGRAQAAPLGGDVIRWTTPALGSQQPSGHARQVMTPSSNPAYFRKPRPHATPRGLSSITMTFLNRRRQLRLWPPARPPSPTPNNYGVQAGAYSVIRIQSLGLPVVGSPAARPLDVYLVGLVLGPRGRFPRRKARDPMGDHLGGLGRVLGGPRARLRSGWSLPGGGQGPAHPDLAQSQAPPTFDSQHPSGRDDAPPTPDSQHRPGYGTATPIRPEGSAPAPPFVFPVRRSLCAPRSAQPHATPRGLSSITMSSPEPLWDPSSPPKSLPEVSQCSPEPLWDPSSPPKSLLESSPEPLWGPSSPPKSLPGVSQSSPEPLWGPSSPPKSLLGVSQSSPEPLWDPSSPPRSLPGVSQSSPEPLWDPSSPPKSLPGSSPEPLWNPSSPPKSLPGVSQSPQNLPGTPPAPQNHPRGPPGSFWDPSPNPQLGRKRPKIWDFCL